MNIFVVISEPPSAPLNLTVNFFDQSTVILSWNTPTFLGGRTDTVYKLECDACGSGVSKNPNTVSYLLSTCGIYYCILLYNYT